MKRREFISLLGGAAAAPPLLWPLTARAQQRDPIPSIGVLSNLAEENPQMKARLAAFVQGLEKRGWSHGQNVRIDARFGAADRDHRRRTRANQSDGGDSNGDRIRFDGAGRARLLGDESE